EHLRADAAPSRGRASLDERARICRTVRHRAGDARTGLDAGATHWLARSRPAGRRDRDAFALYPVLGAVLRGGAHLEPLPRYCLAFGDREWFAADRGRPDDIGRGGAAADRG